MMVVGWMVVSLDSTFRNIFQETDIGPKGWACRRMHVGGGQKEGLRNQLSMIKDQSGPLWLGLNVLEWGHREQVL